MLLDNTSNIASSCFASKTNCVAHLPQSQEKNRYFEDSGDSKKNQEGNDIQHEFASNRSDQ